MPQTKNDTTRRRRLQRAALQKRIARAKRRLAEGKPITKRQERLLKEHG